MYKLADALVSVYSRKDIKEYNDVFALCNRILSECTDNGIRYKTMSTLANAYNYADKKDDMLKIANEMPRAHFSYEDFMLYLWEGTDDLKKRQEYMSYLISQIFQMIDCLSFHRDDEGNIYYTWEERKKLKKLELDLLEILFPDGDYQNSAYYGFMVCSFFVSDCFKSKNYESIWYWLNKGADFAIHADTYDVNTAHTSLILRGYSDGGWIMEACGNYSQCLLDWLTTDEDAQLLKADHRFEELVNRLKAVARKP